MVDNFLVFILYQSFKYGQHLIVFVVVIVDGYSNAGDEFFCGMIE